MHCSLATTILCIFSNNRQQPPLIVFCFTRIKAIRYLGYILFDNVKFNSTTTDRIMELASSVAVDIISA